MKALLIWDEEPTGFLVDFKADPDSFVLVQSNVLDDWDEARRIAETFEHALDPNFAADFALRDRLVRRGAKLHLGYDECKAIIARLKAEGAI